MKGSAKQSPERKKSKVGRTRRPQRAEEWDNSFAAVWGQTALPIFFSFPGSPLQGRHGSDAKRKSSRPIQSLLLLTLLSLLIILGTSGCLGYHIGSTPQATGASTVCVLPFRNDTYEPRLTADITAAVRKRLEQDGTLRLARKSDADILLTGTIKRYTRRGLSFEPGDVRVPRDYEIRVLVHVQAIDQRTGKTLLDQDVQGRSSVRIMGDQPSSERQILPQLADDIARRITSLLVDGTW